MTITRPVFPMFEGYLFPMVDDRPALEVSPTVVTMSIEPKPDGPMALKVAMRYEGGPREWRNDTDTAWHGLGCFDGDSNLMLTISRQPVGPGESVMVFRLDMPATDEP